MKILVISHWYFIEVESIFIRKQVQELQKQGCNVKVVSPTPWTPFPIKYFRKRWRDYSKIPNKMMTGDIEVYYPRYVDFPRSFLLGASGRRMHSGIKKTVDKLYAQFPFDIIHAHAALPDGYAAMMLSREYHTPFIITLRATDLDITIHKSQQCFDIIHDVLKSATKVVVPSPRLSRTLYQQMGFQSSVISHGIHKHELFLSNNINSTYQEKYPVILSVSQLMASKGIDLNIRAVALLEKKYPKIHYLIIGEGEERTRLTNLVKDLNLQGKVEFLGQLPYQKVMEYMSLCDIFCLPSWQETLGLVYLEAMAHGRPIVGCQGQGVDGLITTGETGLLAKPKDIDSIVDAIDFLAANRERALTIGRKAKILILENYTWEKNAEKTIQLFRDVVSSSL